MSIKIQVESDSSSARRDIGQLNKSFSDLNSKTKDTSVNIEKSTKDISNAVSSIRNTVNTLIPVFASLFAASQFTRFQDSITRIDSKIRLVTVSTGEFKQALADTQKIAIDTATDLSAVLDLYTKLTRASSNFGASQQDVARFTKAVSQTLVLSGEAAGQSAAAILQLGQALSSGVLQGDELRSILENAPALAQALAKGLNVSVGQMRLLGHAGRLTAKDIFESLLSQSEDINSQFKKMGVTYSQAFQNLNNAFFITFSNLQRIFKSDNSGIAVWLNNIAKRIYEFGSDLDDKIWRIKLKLYFLASDIFSNFSNIFSKENPIFKFLEKVEEKFKWLYDKVIGRSWVPDLVDGIRFWFNKLAGPFNQVIDYIKELANEFKDFVTPYLLDIKDSIIKFRAWISGLTWGDIKNGIIDAFKSITNYVYKAAIKAVSIWNQIWGNRDKNINPESFVPYGPKRDKEKRPLFHDIINALPDKVQMPLLVSIASLATAAVGIAVLKGTFSKTVGAAIAGVIGVAFVALINKVVSPDLIRPWSEGLAAGIISVLKKATDFIFGEQGFGGILLQAAKLMLLFQAGRATLLRVAGAVATAPVRTGQAITDRLSLGVANRSLGLFRNELDTVRNTLAYNNQALVRNRNEFQRLAEITARRLTPAAQRIALGGPSDAARRLTANYLSGNMNPVGLNQTNRNLINQTQLALTRLNAQTDLIHAQNADQLRLTGVVNTLQERTARLGQRIQEAADNFRNRVVQTGAVAGGTIGGVLGIGLGEKIAAEMVNYSEWAKLATIIITSLVTQGIGATIGGLIAQSFIGIVGLAFTGIVAALSSPVLLIVGAVAALAALWKNKETVYKYLVDTIIPAVKTAFEAVKAWVVKWVPTAINNAVNALNSSDNFDIATIDFSPEAYFGAMKEFYADYWEFIKIGLIKLSGSVKDNFEWLIDENIKIAKALGRLAVKGLWELLDKAAIALRDAVIKFDSEFNTNIFVGIENIAKEFDKIINTAKTLGIELANNIKTNYDSLVSRTTDLMEISFKALGSALDGLIGLISRIKQKIDEASNNTSSRFDQIVQDFKAWRERTFSSTKKETPIDTFASGGYVSGPGTKRSDSIPAYLSNGEFVVNADSTSKHRPLLERINRGFAEGGYVTGDFVSTIRPTSAKNAFIDKLENQISSLINSLAPNINIERITETKGLFDAANHLIIYPEISKSTHGPDAGYLAALHEVGHLQDAIKNYGYIPNNDASVFEMVRKGWDEDKINKFSIETKATDYALQKTLFRSGALDYYSNFIIDHYLDRTKVDVNQLDKNIQETVGNIRALPTLPRQYAYRTTKEQIAALTAPAKEQTVALQEPIKEQIAALQEPVKEQIAALQEPINVPLIREEVRTTSPIQTIIADTGPQTQAVSQEVEAALKENIINSDRIESTRWKVILDKFKELKGKFEEFSAETYEQLKPQLNQLKETVTNINLDKTSKTIKRISSFAKDSFKSILKKASGGFIKGTGSGTSDSIPAMLSNGEFVVNANATSKYRPLLDAINSNKALQYFASGTPAQTHIPFSTRLEELKAREIENLKEIARNMAKKYKLDQSIFLGMIEAESAWNARAESIDNGKGRGTAKGLGQFIDATWQQFSDSSKNVWNATDNLEAAAKYLRHLLDKTGNYPDAIAKYHGGANASSTARDATGITTAEHVQKVMANAKRISSTVGATVEKGWEEAQNLFEKGLNAFLEFAKNIMPAEMFEAVETGFKKFFGFFKKGIFSGATIAGENLGYEYNFPVPKTSISERLQPKHGVFPTTEQYREEINNTLDSLNKNSAFALNRFKFSKEQFQQLSEVDGGALKKLVEALNDAERISNEPNTPFKKSILDEANKRVNELLEQIILPFKEKKNIISGDVKKFATEAVESFRVGIESGLIALVKGQIKIKDFFKSLGDLLTSSIVDVFIKSLLAPFKKIAGEGLTKLFESIGDLAEKKVANKVIDKVFPDTKKKGIDPANYGYEHVTNSIGETNAILTEGWNDLTSVFTDSTLSLGERLSKVFTGIGGTLFGGLMQIVASIYSLVTSQTIKDGVGGIGGLIQKGLAFLSGSDAAPGSISPWGAKGLIVNNSGISAFKHGGLFTNSIVNSPTLFRFAGGTGLMGEAGPEAIMPLKRDAQGRLGVSTDGNKANQQVFNINITGDISRQTRKEIIEMIPVIASGVSNHHFEKGSLR